MGEVLNSGYSIHIVMIKTGEFSFAVARDTLRLSDRFKQQTERSISKA